MKEKKNRRFTRQGNTQKRPRHLSQSTNLSIEISVIQSVNKPAPKKNTERKKAVLELLCRKIHDVKNLVRVQDRSFPTRERKHDPRLVECLIYQTENLLDMLERYVIPQMEQTGSNKD